MWEKIDLKYGIFNNWNHVFLYIKSGYAATVLRHCSFSVFALFISLFIYSGNLVRHFLFLFLVSNSSIVVTVFFLPSVCTFFFFFYIYCFTDTTNFTIFSQLLRCQFLISQNKIIKYEIVTNTQLKINVLWKCCDTCWVNV